MVDISNIKQVAQRADTINQTVDANLEKIHRKYTENGFTEVSSNGFNQTNTIKDLSQNIKFGYSESTIKDIGTDADGHALQSTFPISGAYLKPGVSVSDNVNPKTVISSSSESNTIHTDRKDKNLNIKRWVTRSIFKFREEDYGYDRQVYEIPVKFLMEGVMGDVDRHATTLAQYPYPEEIIMFSQKNKKHFIHFVNVQYSDSHYNYYAAKPYNLMIVKDRVNYGVKNNESDTKFATYTSVYANNINDSLAFYKEEYISFPMPDISFGDELLDTLWDCKVIWRADAPNREFTIQYNVENRTEDINIEDKDNIAWKEITNGLNSRVWRSVCYGKDKYVAVAYRSNTFAYSTDGINWTETSNGITTGDWRSICYGNGKYVAIAEYRDRFAYSTDGINWTTASGNGLTKDWWHSICYGNGKYVMASEHSVFAYSSDGIHWTETTEKLSEQWYSICYGNGKYVAVSLTTARYFAYSTDGINWTETSNGITEGHWRAICYGDGKFIAVHSNSNAFTYSTDGINWVETSDGLTNSIWYSICYGKDKFVAMSGSNVFAYSVPAITSIDLSTTQNLNTISGRSLLSTTNNTVQSNKIDSIKDEYLLSSIPYSPNIINHSIYSYYDDTTSTKDFKLSKIPSYSESTTILSSTVDMKSTLPNMMIPIDNEYLLGIKYLNISSSNKYYTRSTSLSLGVFKHDLVAVSTATSNANYPCDTIISEISGSDYILKVIPLYHTKTLVDGSPQLKFVVYTQTKKYLVIITSTSGILSYTASTLTSYGDILNNVERVNKTQCILFGSSNKVYVDTIEENSYSENPFGITESPAMYLIGRYNLVKIMSNKTVSALGDYSNQSGFNSIANGTSEIALNSMKNNSQGDKLINERFAIMSDSSKSYLTHLRENYSFNIELDEGPTVTQKFEWTETSNGLSGRNWESICYGNEKYVAVAYNSNVFAYSTNGINWTESNNGIGNKYWSSICYGNGKYVAVALLSNTFAYSTNGINWTETNNGIGNKYWQSICYGKDKYVAVASTSNKFAYSTDGITWTENSNGISSRYWTSICYGNGKYVATSTSNTFAYSTDGINWTETSNGIGDREWLSICYGNNKYVAVSGSTSGVSSSNTFAYSTDGINWTDTTNGLGSRNWWSICYGKDKYVAMSNNNNNTFAYSYGLQTIIEQ